MSFLSFSRVMATLHWTALLVCATHQVQRQVFVILILDNVRVEKEYPEDNAMLVLMISSISPSTDVKVSGNLTF